MDGADAESNFPFGEEKKNDQSEAGESKSLAHSTFERVAPPHWPFSIRRRRASSSFFFTFPSFFFVSFAQQKKNKGRSYWPVDFFFAFFFWRRFPFASSFFFSFSGQRDAPSANRMPKRHALHDLEPLIGATATAVIAVNNNNNNNNNNSNSNNNPTNPVKLGTDNKKKQKKTAQLKKKTVGGTENRSNPQSIPFFIQTGHSG